MAHATSNRIRRFFSGKFDEKGEFTPRSSVGAAPHRYFCACNKNGFVARQFIWHARRCHYHSDNVSAFISREERKRYYLLAAIVGSLALVTFVLRHI